MVGLDVDASAVRMVQLRRDRGAYVVVKAGITDIAPWGGNPQLRRVHTIRAIVDGLLSGGVSGKFAVCGLRGPEVVVRGFEFPALPPEEIEGAVELEVSQICPFLAEESTLDYQVTSSGDKNTTGFWVAATNGLIQDTRQLVAEAGLRCARIDVVGLALLNLLNADQEGQETQDGKSSVPDPWSRVSRTAVLNLDDACATIAIADPAGRPFVRDIAGAAPADSRRPLAAARYGAAGSFAAEADWAARSDHRSVTDDALVDDVASTLRYYAAQGGSTKVDRLLVCGGWTAQESLEPLGTRLNIEVQPWNPVARLRCEPDPEWNSESLLHESGGSLAVAAGLAMRHV